MHFDDLEKEALCRLLWKMSDFCGVKVVTYRVMSNHFHVPAEVPWREVWRGEHLRAAPGEVWTEAEEWSTKDRGEC